MKIQDYDASSSQPARHVRDARDARVTLKMPRRAYRRAAIYRFLATAMVITACALPRTPSHAATAGDASAAPSPVTFAHDVAPLLYANCTTCHRPGEAAPFSLLTYEDAQKHAKQIVRVTSRRIMPPWKAEHGFGTFVGERRLADEQMAILQRWAELGCPEGNAAAAPKPPEFADGWELGPPDLILRMPEPFTLAATGRDVYRCFIIPVQIPAGKYLRAAEYRPGNRKIVHHAVLTSMRPEQAQKLLAAEPAGTGPGFSSGLAAPGDRLPGPLGIWAPGKPPLPTPEGYAMAWPGGSNMILQLHLHPDGKPEAEQSSVGFYFTDKRPVGRLEPVVLMNARVDIAPGLRDYKLTASTVLKFSARTVGIFPHMHLLGRTVRATATLPSGEVVPLLSIGDWDFNWQGYYLYAVPAELPIGTRLDAEWTFDNSAENPANPSQPPKRVVFGEQTTNEMGALVLDVIPTSPVPPRRPRGMDAVRETAQRAK